MLAKLIGELNLASNHKLALFRYSKMVLQHPDDVRVHVLLGKVGTKPNRKGYLTPTLYLHVQVQAN